jgi:hypothetical protein
LPLDRFSDVLVFNLAQFLTRHLAIEKPLARCQ